MTATKAQYAYIDTLETCRHYENKRIRAAPKKASQNAKAKASKRRTDGAGE